MPQIERVRYGRKEHKKSVTPNALLPEIVRETRRKYKRRDKRRKEKSVQQSEIRTAVRALWERHFAHPNEKAGNNKNAQD